MAEGCNHFSFTDDGDSFESWQGLRGPYYTPHLSADGVMSWTNTGNLPNPAPVDISGPPGVSVELRGPVATTSDLPATASSSELWLVGTASPYDGWFYNGVRWENAGQIAVGPPGPAGEDGVSPEISVTDITGGHRVTIIDATGTKTFDVMDGTDGQPGQPGQPGAPGADGVSPEISVTDITGGHRITITDATGTETFDVMDGTDGQPGQPGAPGAPGADGVSPEISVTDITGGHRITITDATGTETFDVMDGTDGQSGPAGPGVPTGGAAGQVLKKQSSTDYDAEWKNEDLGISGASVDDFVKIAAVDANGKPTAFGKGTPSGGALYFTGVAISATTGDIASISNAKITADHVVAECIFASPSAITTDVTWTTSAGSLVLNGACSAATTADIVLVKKSN